MASPLRLDPEHEAMLAELAEADGVSRVAYLRRAIESLHAERLRDQRVREAFDLVDTRDAELLDRLARG